MKQELSDAVTDYLALRSSQDLGKGTLTNEKGVLKRLLAVNGNIWVHQITERHVTRYFENAARTRSAQTLHLDHSTLNQFFDWARRTKRLPLDMDPMAGRRRPKGWKRERNRVPRSDFARLLDAAEQQCPRDRAAVAILLYLLLRDQEAADLRVGDVDLAGGTIRVRVSKSRIEDDMPICTELDAELRRWLTIYSAEAQHPLENQHYLLPRRQSIGVAKDERGRIVGHDLVYAPHKSIGRLGRVISPCLEAIGFPVQDSNGRKLMEGAHTIRRSGARALYDRLAGEGYDRALRLCQSLLHHSTVATTERYLGVTADKRSRDEILRGQPMFPSDSANVIQLSV